MRAITLFFSISSFFLFVIPSFGADVAKIGIIDFQRIVQTSSAGKIAMAEINKKGKEMEADLKKRGGELEELKKKFDREALVMSKEMREQKGRDFRIKLNDFKTLEKKYSNDLRTLNTRLVSRIQKEVFKLVEEMGKKEGFLMVMERMEGGVVYFPNSIDITDRIIQKYNTDFTQKSNKKPETKKK
ncbi:OmpH family outer membrane protein [Thermodesulfobacteriota bacterium]